MENIILASSENHIIIQEFETVSLLRIKDNFKVIIGDFYGDPTCAFISNDERFCIVGGYGFIIYNIREPFIPYEYDKKTKQWTEFYKEKHNVLWIDNIYMGDLKNEIKIVVDPNDKVNGGIYIFNLKTYQLKKELP